MASVVRVWTMCGICLMKCLAEILLHGTLLILLFDSMPSRSCVTFNTMIAAGLNKDGDMDGHIPCLTICKRGMRFHGIV